MLKVKLKHCRLLEEKYSESNHKRLKLSDTSESNSEVSDSVEFKGYQISSSRKMQVHPFQSKEK